MSHQEWCDITRDHFREAHFSRKDLKDVAKSITLIPGTREVLESLRARDIKLYILSGSIKQIIYEVLGDLRGYFEDIRANDISFDSSGIIRKISGTLYDFEGKATFLSRIIAENEYSPFDVLFVGTLVMTYLPVNQEPGLCASIPAGRMVTRRSIGLIC